MGEHEDDIKKYIAQLVRISQRWRGLPELTIAPQRWGLTRAGGWQI